MKILRISWTNYKNLADGAIDACGNNVTISGRNGTGKSSIASVLPFILFGKDTDKVKQYADGITPRDDGLIHAAEVSFDDGTTLRREYFWQNGGNRHALYVNGASVNQSAFKAHVEKITRGGGEIVINPFAFHALKAADQREILMRAFGTVGDADLLADEFPQLAEHLDGQPVDVFITRAKKNLDSLKKNANQIPARLEELQRQVESLNVDAELRSVERELAAAQSERHCQPNQRDFNIETALLLKRRGELERMNDRYTRELEDLSSCRQSLLDEYQCVRKSKGICPTCGQPLPAEQFKSKRDAKLADIKRQGLQCKSEIEEHEKILADIGEERRALENQIARMQSDAQTQENHDARIKELDAQIERLTTRKGQLQSQKATLDRIQALHDQERDLNRKIAKLEGQIADAENFRRRKLELVEDSINSRFKFVKFKLFDYLVTSDDARPTCEATLNGVPYTALSKGEKLRAALDTFRTLRNAFGVELPVMLDDAESYTQNSFVDIPNQIFAFKVTDDDLNIRVVTSCATNAA